MEGHWTETFEHESVTPETSESFKTANAKYGTINDAVVGGYNAQKMAGKPFRVPEDMAKLPDDQSRADFTSQARRALGINIAKDVDGLKDVDFKAGLAEGANYDENFVGIIKNWAVEKGVDTATLAKLAPLYNGPLTEYSAKAHKEATDAAELARMTKCNEELIAMPDIGSKEKLAEMTELFRRGVVNHPSVSADDAVEIFDAMVDGGLTQNSKLSKIMLDVFGSLAKEGSSDGGDGSGGGGGVKQLSPYEAKKARWPKTSSEWGDPNDQWENESANTKKALGYKEG